MKRRRENGETVFIRNGVIISRAVRDDSAQHWLILPTLMLANVRSILNKFDNIVVSINSLNVDMFCATETWLKSPHDNKCFAIPGYSFLRCDRAQKIWGGVCCWIRDSLKPKLLFSTSNINGSIANTCNFEIIFINLQLCNILLIIAYIPPASTADQQSKLSKYITHKIDDFLLEHPDNSIVLCGDFNKSDICTSSLSNNFSLSNCVTTTTRKNAILDLILVSDNLIDSISECLVGPPIYIYLLVITTLY